ncbi:MAG TPA: hypothetical protein VGL72_01310 [Bryobacteraceae bacterium]|jgi:hypothetical protein
MTGVLLKSSTWIVFAVIAGLAFLIAAFSRVMRIGSQSIGFPFRFYESTSAPPPAFGHTFSWKFLILDLLIYYVVAVFLNLIWNLLRSPSNS